MCSLLSITKLWYGKMFEKLNISHFDIRYLESQHFAGPLSYDWTRQSSPNNDEIIFLLKSIQTSEFLPAHTVSVFLKWVYWQLAKSEITTLPLCHPPFLVSQREVALPSPHGPRSEQFDCLQKNDKFKKRDGYVILFHLSGGIRVVHPQLDLKERL